MLRRTRQPPWGGAGSQHQTPWYRLNKEAETLSWEGRRGAWMSRRQWSGELRYHNGPFSNLRLCDWLLTRHNLWNINLLPFFWHVPFHMQVFLDCSKLFSFLFFFFYSIPSSFLLVPVSELHLLPSWKYNLVGYPMHSCEKCFSAIWDFSTRLFFFSWVFKKEDSNFKNKKNSYCHSDFQGNMSKRNGTQFKQKIKWSHKHGNLLISSERIN